MKTASPYLLIILSLLTLLATSSCGKKNAFKLDAKLANLQPDEVRVIYQNDSGIVDMWVPLSQGKLSYQGTDVSQPVLLTVLDRKSQVLAYAVVQAGDHVKMSGDASKQHAVKVTGTKLNERWQLFRDEHAAFYADPNPSRLDAAIEKYIGENQSDMLSTVLLLVDYSNLTNRQHVDEMLKSISDEARPASLTQSYEALSSGKRSLPRVPQLKLWQRGNYEEVSLLGHTTLLYLWTRSREVTARNAVVNELKELAANTAVTVADVLIESDSIMWSKTIAGDSVAWQHYWAPCGPQDGSLRLLGITSTPWFTVTDGDGLVAYNGVNLQQACRIAREKCEQEQQAKH